MACSTHSSPSSDARIRRRRRGMKFRNLGKSGLLVSTVGLGCNNFGWRADLAQTKAIIHKALDMGITFFDTADSYGPSEEFIGETLGARRAEVVLATKFSSPL